MKAFWQYRLPDELMSHILEYTDALMLHLIRCSAKSAENALCSAAVLGWPACARVPQQLANWKSAALARNGSYSNHCSDAMPVADALSATIGTALARFLSRGDALGLIALMHWSIQHSVDLLAVDIDIPVDLCDNSYVRVAANTASITMPRRLCALQLAVSGSTAGHQACTRALLDAGATERDPPRCVCGHRCRQEHVGAGQGLPTQFEHAAVLWRGCCCGGEETAVFRAVRSRLPGPLLSALLRARTRPRHAMVGAPQHRWQEEGHARNWSSCLPLASLHAAERLRCPLRASCALVVHAGHSARVSDPSIVAALLASGMDGTGATGEYLNGNNRLVPSAPLPQLPRLSLPSLFGLTHMTRGVANTRGCHDSHYRPGWHHDPLEDSHFDVGDDLMNMSSVADMGSALEASCNMLALGQLSEDLRTGASGTGTGTCAFERVISSAATKTPPSALDLLCAHPQANPASVRLLLGQMQLEARQTNDNTRLQRGLSSALALARAVCRTEAGVPRCLGIVEQLVAAGAT